jgi:hypothetical protein
MGVASSESLAALSLHFFQCLAVKTLKTLPRSSSKLDAGSGSMAVAAETCSRCDSMTSLMRAAGGQESKCGSESWMKVVQAGAGAGGAD